MSFHQPSPGAYGAAPHIEQPEPPRARGRRGRKNAEGGDNPMTKKVVNSSLRWAVGLGVVTALVGGLVVTGSQAPDLYVVRAKDAIGAGSPINVTTQLEAVPITKDLVEDKAYTGTSADAALATASDDLENARAQYPIAAKSQIGTDDFNVELMLDPPLESSERLMSISATVSNALAGQIKTGDHVDIAASDDEVSGVVLSDVEVVAVTVSESQYQSVADQQTGEAKNTKPSELLPGDPVPGIYTVRVSSADAARLYAVQSGAELALIYRPKDATASELSAKTAKSVICEGSAGTDGCR